MERRCSLFGTRQRERLDIGPGFAILTMLPISGRERLLRKIRGIVLRSYILGRGIMSSVSPPSMATWNLDCRIVLFRVMQRGGKECCVVCSEHGLAGGKFAVRKGVSTSQGHHLC